MVEIFAFDIFAYIYIYWKCDPWKFARKQSHSTGSLILSRGRLKVTLDNLFMFFMKILNTACISKNIYVELSISQKDPKVF